MANPHGDYQLARRAFSDGDWAECIRLAAVVLSNDPRHGGAMDLIASARRGLEISERGRGERRLLSILFCDLVGSVSLAAELGAERYRGLLLDVQDLCVRAITAYEGRVAQYLGDGILAYFSYPQSHEDDAARATMAALEIADTVRTRAERYRQDYGREVAIRIGIDTGTVVAGAMGSGQWTTSDSIVGDSINVASRVQSLAGPNSVLITDATYSLASAAVVANGPQTVELRNFPRPVTIWNAVGASPTRASARPPRPNRALVGRHIEVALLNRAWSAALRGGSRQCMIVGDPGMGKTRLAEHAINLCHAGGGRLIELRCSAVWAHSSLWPAAVALRRLLGLEEHDPDSFLQLLRERLRTIGGSEPSPDVVALLGRLLGAPVKIDLLPEQIRIMTMRALADLVAAVATQSPVLLVVEDLHDADASTVELLQHLVARTDLPLLLLITSRRAHPELPFVEEVVTLEPLSDDASADLAASLLPTGEDSEIRALVSRGDGVPLFIEELAYGLADGIALEGLPLTLSALLAVRLDDLDPPCTRIVEALAVLAVESDPALVRELAALDPVSFSAGVDTLVSRRVLVPGTNQTRNLGFRHALIREATYDRQLAAPRQSLHGQAGTVLARLRDSGNPVPAEQIAGQFVAAGERATAFPWWQQASRDSVASAASVEAIEHCRQALMLLDVLADGAHRGLAELELQLTLAFSTSTAEGYASPRAEEAYHRAVALAYLWATSSAALPAIWGLWSYAVVRGDHAEAADLAKRALTLAADADDEARYLAASITGYQAFYSGRFDDSRRDLTLGTRGGGHPDLPNDPAIACRSLLAVVHLLTGDRSAAEAELKAAQEAATKLTDRRAAFTQAYVGAYEAWFHQLDGAPTRAVEAAIRTMELAAEHNFPTWLGAGMLHLAIARASLGEPGAADELEAGIEMWRKVGGAELLVPYFLGQLGEARLAAGALSKAEEALNSAISTAEASGERFYLPLLLLARSALDTPDPSGRPPADIREAALHEAAAQGWDRSRLVSDR